jgi:hypothetical protein
LYFQLDHAFQTGYTHEFMYLQIPVAGMIAPSGADPEAFISRALEHLTG